MQISPVSMMSQNSSKKKYNTSFGRFIVKEDAKPLLNHFANLKLWDYNKKHLKIASYCNTYLDYLNEVAKQINAQCHKYVDVILDAGGIHYLIKNKGIYSSEIKEKDKKLYDMFYCRTYYLSGENNGSEYILQTNCSTEYPRDITCFDKNNNGKSVHKVDCSEYLLYANWIEKKEEKNSPIDPTQQVQKFMDSFK